MTIIQIIPNVVSPSRKLFMSFNIDTIMSIKVDPAALTPIKSLICDATISIATADVNPEFTGPEMKSIKKPTTSQIRTLLCHLQNNMRCSVQRKQYNSTYLIPLRSLSIG